MPSKKSTSAAKSARGKKRPRLTAAIGPKATVTVVIVVLAGGLILGAHQSHSKNNVPSDARLEMAPMPEAPAKKIAAPTGPAVSMTPAAPTTSATAASKGPFVTVTGCLEGADGAFRLKDTAGADAPKSRSWKSGFLKKGSATIDLADAAHATRLADNVGRRVSVTGTLVDREMQVRSMRRVSATCDQ
jgi:hypothetical protein